MKMVQRIDTLSLKKPRKSPGTGTMFESLKMQEEEKVAKLRGKPKP